MLTNNELATLLAGTGVCVSQSVRPGNAATWQSLLLTHAAILAGMLSLLHWLP